jgi:CheY-like chemotaxis protein
MPAMPKTLLVIDDDVLHRESLSYLLSAEGYEVRCVADGAEALAALQFGMSPDLILLDLKMPGMSGWQFRQEQRRQTAWAAVPVLLLTGDPEADRQAREIGAVEWIRKPIEISALLAAIRRLCP